MCWSDNAQPPEGSTECNKNVNSTLILEAGGGGEVRELYVDEVSVEELFMPGSLNQILTIHPCSVCMGDWLNIHSTKCADIRMRLNSWSSDL